MIKLELLKNKSIGVLGLGVTGLSSIKAIKEYAKVYIGIRWM